MGSAVLQDLTAQRQALAALGVPDDRIYLDKGLTGTSRARPGLASSLNNLSNRLADQGRSEDALATIEEAVTIRRELARWPDASQVQLELSLGVVAWLEAGGDLSDASPGQPKQ